MISFRIRRYVQGSELAAAFPLYLISCILLAQQGGSKLPHSKGFAFFNFDGVFGEDAGNKLSRPLRDAFPRNQRSWSLRLTCLWIVEKHVTNM
jgi:hypothetical protein